MLRKFLLLFFVSLAYLSNAHAASEKISNFVSSITVNRDASIDVSEDISVYANNERILHGIVRYLPIRYTDSYGINRHTTYKITQILLNGEATAYHTARHNNKLAIFIGDNDVILHPGVYTYTIRYHVNNAVNFLRDGDEIYWNITGNAWAFPIDKAQATIQLPATANIANYFGYTGMKGAKGQDFIINRTAANQIQFVTKNVLQPGEGLTVAVAWQKGIVHELTGAQWLAQQLYWSDFLVIVLTLLLFIYYFYVWYLFGRGPISGPIIPLFEPPENLTPEALRYILRMGFDAKTFSAAIVNMAASGYLTIENKYDVFTFKKTQKAADSLPVEERALASELFSYSTSIIISQANREPLRNARSALKDTLSDLYQDKYFVTNIYYLLPGVCITLIAFVASIIFADNINEAAFAVLWLSVWTFACGFLLIQVFNAIQFARVTRSIKNIVTAVFTTLYCIPFLGGEVAGIYALSDVIPLFTIPMLFLMVVLNIIFDRILKAPTARGRQLMDKIEGFKLFFTITERYRFEQMFNIKKTPELFEKYLPYAIALDMESEWSEQFNEVLRNAGIAPNTYQPTWYSGSAWSSQNFSTLPVMLGAGLASSLASASTSTSSSASGGGGSSGGGGGGGGGGGW